MKLSISRDLATRLQSFQSSPCFALDKTSLSYSPYWIHHAEEIRVDLDVPSDSLLASVTVTGDSGFYFPKPPPTVGSKAIVAFRGLLSRLKRASKIWVSVSLRNGPDYPISVSYTKAFDSCQMSNKSFTNMGPDIVTFPNSADAVIKEFGFWSGRESNDHILIAYYFLKILDIFSALPKEGCSYLEIGAGNGNLASLVMHYFPSVKIIIVDLPETLQLSICYLGSMYPDRCFALPNEVEERGIGSADCTFLSPEQVHLIPDSSVGLGVNIHSFQEMTAQQINLYFLLFARTLNSSGKIFIANRVEKAPVPSEDPSFDGYVNRFSDYPWPPEWEDVFYRNSPFHRLVQTDNIFIRLMKAGRRDTVVAK